MAADKQQEIAEFERSRAQLMGLSGQKRNMQMQANILEATIDELGKTKEKTVYKIVGNIMVPADSKSVLKDAKGQKETVDLRLKTLQKQEDALIEKLNKLKSQIEGKPAEKADKADKKDKE